MKRVLLGLAIGAAALTSAPAHAAGGYDVDVHLYTGPDRVGAGASYSRDGQNYDPVGAAWFEPGTGRVCGGLSYQTGICTPRLDR